MRPNPNTGLITDEMWRFWSEFDQFDADHILDEEVELSGIYADKPGYHNTVDRNQARWPGNYSIRYNLDLKGIQTKARAIDLTFKSAQSGDHDVIIKYTKRLFDAIERKDPRLYINGQPILREAIGTLDGKVALGYDTLSRVKTKRSLTHLWHIHLSIFATFINNWQALSQLLSVMKGEPMPDIPNPQVPTLDWMDLLVKERMPILKEGAAPVFETRIWQHILNEHGFATKVDGDFGPQSKANTLKLQVKYAAESKDGQVGPETWTIGLTKKDQV